ncbi:MAG: M18 family aminopeptidase [Acidiferrobacteraceae bacterium]|mgnify:CR=1 FL=1|nr:M18 family aminopeptidase [Acidiferrobacteraceae bacterium]MCP4828858.1 M18 family aminopeptidase [Pseudomonadota bacterium]
MGQRYRQPNPGADTVNPENFNLDLLEYLDHSPSPFHAVANMIERLQQQGFSKLDSSANWSISGGDKALVTRNDSSLIAWRMGSAPISETGIRMIGAHTDSPCLRIKPQPDIQREGFIQLGVEIYGGVLLAPWFDRDLSLAGRISCRTSQGKHLSLLIDFKRAVATIPSLAIHLDRTINQDRTINPQRELVPILCDLAEGVEPGFRQNLADQARHQYPSAHIETVTDFEISCYDVQPGQRLGINGDYLVSARLDNLLSCYVGLRSLLDADTEQTVLLVCNDHEEVGSTSAAGAQGPFLRSILERLSGDGESMARALSRSLLVSTDNAHAVHPNYKDKHDPQHRPRLNAGPVIKFNANQRYATSSTSAAIFRDLCAQAQVPVQSIAMRSDMACGSTIGPITAAAVGVDAVDVGAPQLGMHSPRETTGWHDPAWLYLALKTFFESPALTSQ